MLRDTVLKMINGTPWTNLSQKEQAEIIDALNRILSQKHLDVSLENLSKADLDDVIKVFNDYNTILKLHENDNAKTADWIIETLDQIYSSKLKNVSWESLSKEEQVEIIKEYEEYLNLNEKAQKRFYTLSSKHAPIWTFKHEQYSQHESNRQSEFISAFCKASRDFKSIYLSNNDPDADFKALIEKNREALQKNGFVIKEFFKEYENKCAEFTIVLVHETSGQYSISNMRLRKNSYSPLPPQNDPWVLRLRRMVLEGMLGLASYNNAVEAECFNPDGALYEVPGTRTLSWTDIKLFKQCRRCFYIAKKFGFRLNDYDDAKFGLEKVTDKLLKREFDEYRKKGDLPPILIESNVKKLLKHKKFSLWRKAWRNGPKGIQFRDVWNNYLIYGAIDDIGLNDKKEMIMIDYKSSSNGKIYEEYQKQLEFYAWIFKKNNYDVASIGYLLVYSPIEKKTFDWKLEVSPRLIKKNIDDTWVEEEIANALACLEKDEIPMSGAHPFKAGEKCPLCDYFDKLNSKLPQLKMPPH